MTIPRIALFQPYYELIGHFGQYYDVFHRTLKKNGYEITGVIGLKPGSVTEYNDTESYHFKSTNKVAVILSSWRGLRLLCKRCKEQDIRVIHLLDTETLILGLFVFLNRKFLKNRRLIVTQHSGNFFISPRENLIVYLYRLLTKYSYRTAQKYCDLRIVTNGPLIAETLLKYAGLERKTVVTSNWGTNLVPDSPLSEKEPDTFLLFGIIRRDKNLEYVLEQFAGVKHPYKLIIAGYPKDYTVQEINNLVNQSKIRSEQIEMHLDYFDTPMMMRFFDRSKFILIPYESDNHSNSGPLISSLQFDCIPIVSNYGQRGDLVRRYKIGFCFDFERPEHSLGSVVSSILSGISEQEYVEQIKSVKNNFIWDSIIDDLLINKRIYIQS